MLKCYHCPEAQTWAAWALASLTNADQTKKYRQLTLEEGGFEALKDLIGRSETTDFVRDKAQRVIERVQEYLNEQIRLNRTADGDDHMPDMSADITFRHAFR